MVRAPTAPVPYRGYRPMSAACFGRLSCAMGLLTLNGFGAVLAGVLLLTAARRREHAVSTPVEPVPAPPAARPLTARPAAGVYRGRHARTSTTGVMLLVLVSVSVLAVRSARR